MINATSAVILSDVRKSRAGYDFSFENDLWRLSKDTSINLSWLRSLDSDCASSFRNVFSFYAENYSGGHCNNLCDRLAFYFRETKAKNITSEDLISFRSTLDSSHEWYLSVIRVFLLKCHSMGYGAISESVYILLKNMKLKGNRKGRAVKSLDPETGPFSDLEYEAIFSELPEALASEKLDIESFVLVLMFLYTGRRPRQLADLKVVDLYVTKNKKGLERYFISIPRIKQQGVEVGWREVFRSFAISNDTYSALKALIDSNITKISNILGRDLTVSESKLLPIFMKLKDFESVITDGVSDLESMLANDTFHLKSSALNDRLKKAIAALNITSERTGCPLKLSTRRFRYTLGTRTAREGYGEMVIAEMLDHSDSQNTAVYVKNSPEYAKKISELMNGVLLTYVQAFTGTIVRTESDALRGNEKESRVRNDESNLGTCGSFGHCSAMAPIACYTCKRFQPWLDAPHESVLRWLVQERERISEMTGDLGVSAINDRTIIAVTQVVEQCKKLKESNEND